MNTPPLLLPAIINPPRFRKDGSAAISFDTRELSPEEVLIIMGYRNCEGWVQFSPNREMEVVPGEDAMVDEKSPSERLRAVLFVWYKQEVENGKYIGLYETFRREKMEKIIDGVKSKLN